MSSATIALVAIFTVSLLWATANVVGKILLNTFAPFPLAFLRFLIASLAILPFYLKQKRPSGSKLIQEVVPISLLSTGNIFFFYLGLTRTTANASAIIYTATPLIVAVLAQKILHETLSAQKIVGVLLGFIGVLTILVSPALETGNKLSGDVVGNVTILLATCCWAFYTLGSRYLLNKKGYSPLTVSSVSIFISAVVFGILTFTSGDKNFILPLLKGSHLILILHLAILVTVATYLLFQWAIKHASATTVSLNNYLQPVFAIGLGIIILGEPLTPAFIIGALLVLTGVFLASGSQLMKELRHWISRLTG